ncbi:MAG: glutathione S-transferase family protein [Amaricoccus sp.]
MIAAGDDLSPIILHHYPTSTFSERVRLALGLKRLRYRSVTIPSAMPKPDLLPLTGGYRRTPVMQIGADVYCDTSLILRRIEALHPEPTLYPGKSEGIVQALTWWADKTLFWPALGVLAATIGHRIPPDFIAERRAFGFPLAPEDVAPELPRHLQQGAAHFGWLAAMLADGRPYLLGDVPSAADFAAYSPLWVLRDQGGPDAEAKLPLARFAAWRDRIAAIGHGEPVPTTAGEALAIAAAADPAPVAPEDVDPSGLRIGAEVIVAADDTGRDPVQGTLVSAGAQQLVVRTGHPRTGAINLHFPRAGFDIVPAGKGR